VIDDTCTQLFYAGRPDGLGTASDQ